MWQVYNLKNTVEMTKDQALEFLTVKSYVENMYGDGVPSRDLESILTKKKGKYFLIFSEDHMEHIDYLATDNNIVNKLKSLKVKGEISFFSSQKRINDTINAWGYFFDGEGGMKKTVGVLEFHEK
jgi:hypothetical protein